MSKWVFTNKLDLPNPIDFNTNMSFSQNTCLKRVSYRQFTRFNSISRLTNTIRSLKAVKGHLRSLEVKIELKANLGCVIVLSLLKKLSEKMSSYDRCAKISPLVTYSSPTLRFYLFTNRKSTDLYLLSQFKHGCPNLASTYLLAFRLRYIVLKKPNIFSEPLSMSISRMGRDPIDFFLFRE